MAPPAGFEPTTVRLEGGCSILLSYGGRRKIIVVRCWSLVVASLAVIAHIRHNETNYDELLGSGWERSEARRAVAAAVDEILIYWEAGRPDQNL